MQQLQRIAYPPSEAAELLGISRSQLYKISVGTKSARSRQADAKPSFLEKSLSVGRREQQGNLLFATEPSCSTRFHGRSIPAICMPEICSPSFFYAQELKRILPSLVRASASWSGAPGETSESCQSASLTATPGVCKERRLAGT